MYDFISVDGRARVHCLKRALPLLKPEGGILMLVCTCCCTLAVSRVLVWSWDVRGISRAMRMTLCCADCRITRSGNGMQMHSQQCQSTGSNLRTLSTQVDFVLSAEPMLLLVALIRHDGHV